MSKMYRELIIFAFFITSWCSLTLADPSANNNKSCGDIGDCPTIDTDCKDICGCDKTIPTTFDNKTQQCIINIKLLILSLKEKYNTEDDNDFSTEDDGMATKIRAEADKIFKGVIVAAFLFIACAATCTLTACIYCCRMNYTDYQLKKSIKVLAKKMGTKSQPAPLSPAPKATTTTEPIAESCNVVVEDAGVFCV